MKKNIPLAFTLLALMASLAFLSSCQRSASHEVVRIGIARNLTHLAVGQTGRLTVFQEYRHNIHEVSSAHAAPVRDTLREVVAAQLSLSDTSLARLSDDGQLTALKPGHLTIKSAWGGFEASTTVEVLNRLPVERLPVMTANGSACAPQGVALRLDEDRKLRFDLSLDGQNCEDISVEASAPEKLLPWEIAFNGGTLRLTQAQGPIISGEANINGQGQVAFKVWSEGAGSFPISLAGKKVLLVGDSMAEGIGPFLRKKVDAAGGQFVGEPWCSSTCVSWEETGRLNEALAKHNPDIVFIALGSNEIFINALETRAAAIKRMVAAIGDRPGYWIGPPSWKPDHGIVRVIEENFQPGHFYNSNSLVVPRRKDGAHPKVEGYETWTELIWKWYARTI